MDEGRTEGANCAEDKLLNGLSPGAELHLADCRLLETCSDKEESLRQLVSALKPVSSLHTLCLPQNRLGEIRLP